MVGPFRNGEYREELDARDLITRLPQDLLRRLIPVLYLLYGSRIIPRYYSCHFYVVEPNLSYYSHSIQDV